MALRVLKRCYRCNALFKLRRPGWRHGCITGACPTGADLAARPRMHAAALVHERARRLTAPPRITCQTHNACQTVKRQAFNIDGGGDMNASKVLLHAHPAPVLCERAPESGHLAEKAGRHSCEDAAGCACSLLPPCNLQRVNRWWCNRGSLHNGTSSQSVAYNDRQREQESTCMIQACAGVQTACLAGFTTQVPATPSADWNAAL